jgi:hypothetical protein
MFFQANLERKLAELGAQGGLPLAIEFWDGRRIELGGRPTVTLRVPRSATCTTSWR